MIKNKHPPHSHLTFRHRNRSKKHSIIKIKMIQDREQKRTILNLTKSMIFYLMKASRIRRSKLALH